MDRHIQAAVQTVARPAHYGTIRPLWSHLASTMEIGMSDKPILVINSGSSSLKFALIETKHQQTLAAGIAERLRTAEARLVLQKPRKNVTELPQADHQAAIQALFRYLERTGTSPEQLLGVGHRVVHGGEAFQASILVDDQVLAEIGA